MLCSRDGQHFLKRARKETVRLCKPYSLCYSYSTLPLQHKSSLRQYINNEHGSDPISIYKNRLEANLAHRPHLAKP